MKERHFGLIGYPLSHSFSRKYFTEKFEREGIIGASYHNFPISSIEALPRLLKEHPLVVGLNVTIPYKQAVIPYMQELSEDAKSIGAVNTIVVGKDGVLSGYNSDIYGFRTSLERFLPNGFSSGAMILGTGGASKAVAYVCRQLNMNVLLVSRSPGEDRITYDELDESILSAYRLIINTTPLGMSPHTESAPDVPYHLLNNKHYLYDLIYNPEETVFLQHGKSKGSQIKNGMEMLILQAEKSWEIWNHPPLIKQP